MTQTRFSGFPPDALTFLEALAANNDRAWFQAHKARYTNSLLEPALAFIAAVGDQLAAIAPGTRYDLSTNGAGSLMRIYRDTRFSHDKTPYKTELTGMWWSGKGKKTTSAAFGFRLTSADMGLMAGMIRFDKAQLDRYRAAVTHPTRGAALEAIIADLVDDPYYAVAGDLYQRVPAGFDAPPARADLLRRKGLYAHPAPLPPAVITSPVLVDTCLAHFSRLASLHQWLHDNVVDSA